MRRPTLHLPSCAAIVEITEMPREFAIGQRLASGDAIAKTLVIARAYVSDSTSGCTLHTM